MSTTLRDLLTQEFPQLSKSKKRTKPSNPTSTAISLCRDHKSVDLRPDRSLRRDGSSSFSSNGTNSKSAGPNSNSRATTVESSCDDKPPAIDEVAISRVISVLSGYIGRFLKDEGFRKRIREKCTACLAVRKDAAHAVLVNLEMGMENIERLAEDPGTSKESKVRSLRNSIRLLSIVASLSSPKSRNGYTCGVPNSHLSACAQLYLSVVYKIEKSDRISSRHLLQVFCDSPYLARKNLLPDLWEHFLLPHLLHLKVWYNQEVDITSNLGSEERTQRMKGLNRVYNDQMDVGTAQFALYYKEWLKVGARAPVLPSVSLPRRRNIHILPGNRSLSASQSSINKSLYQAVFGPSDGHNHGVLLDRHCFLTDEEMKVEETSCKLGNSVHTEWHWSSPGLPNHVQDNPTPESASSPPKRNSFSVLSCRGSNRDSIHYSQLRKDEPAAVARKPDTKIPWTNLGRAISLISSSDSLRECENAVHVVSKAWLDTEGDPTIEVAMSNSSVIEGILEITFNSKDHKVLELAISMLAELVVRNDVNRKVVLNADPQLEVFRRLLGSNNHFLKAAVLLYLLKPKAKQMLSLDWLPLALRVLECGDQLQTLFTVQCNPKSAAFYFLDQLLRGFDVDRNLENAKQLVLLGGLPLLIRKLEVGDACERKNAASLLVTCVRADWSCRVYLVSIVKKASILELLIGNQIRSNGCGLSLLIELICLPRRTQVTKFLNGLKNEGCLNAMHILLVYLQQAPLDQRPLIAAILLQLDLLGDHLRYSVYREESIDAIIVALDCKSQNRRVQEHCSKALLLLAGRFSRMGKSSTETWLLKRAGFNDYPADLTFGNEELLANQLLTLDEEEHATEVWLRRLASVLLTRGNKPFLAALSICIKGGIPCLARSCLATIAWMSSFLSLEQNDNSLFVLACSILMPRLLDTLSYDRALEERVLASLSLFNFARNSECRSKIFPFNEESTGLLQDLAKVTWTAKEILLLAKS